MSQTHAGNRVRQRLSRRLPTVLLILVPGLLTVWSLTAIQRLDHREAVSRQFAEHGVRVIYEDRVINECPLWRRVLFSIPGGLAFSRPLLLDAQRSGFNDEAMVLLTQIPKLRRLWLWGSQVSDDGLAALPYMPRLESFSVPENATEHGLVCLKNFPALKSLQLVKADVSPTVVDWILKMRMLEDLDLRGSMIDSKQLDRLRNSDQKLRIQI